MVLWRYSIRASMAGYLIALRLASFLSAVKKPRKRDQYEVLLTGKFYSDNWIYAQLMPLVLSTKTKRIRMVAEDIVPLLPKVEAVYPSKKLSRLVGKGGARLLTFTWLSLTTKTDVIGGFHLLVNGMLAIFLGRLVRARSLYICGGGAREVAGGGYACENKIFGKLDGPDEVVEKQLLKAVFYADIVVTRGQQTINFFQGKGVKSNFNIIPGGVDGRQFKPTDTTKEYDLVLMGRLTEIKRVDTYLRAIEIISRFKPSVRALVIGDGPLLLSLEALASKLGITDNVCFLGHRNDVDVLLPKAKVFVLTSDSEGLSQAMIQAMLCGLPSVVSDVGDLKELVENGKNGYLITERSPEAFANAAMTLLHQPVEKMVQMCELARASALRCDIEYVGKAWDRILND